MNSKDIIVEKTLMIWKLKYNDVEDKDYAN